VIQYSFALLGGVRLRWEEEARARKTGARHFRHTISGPIPGSLAVWVPVYNEKLDWLRFCLDRLRTTQFDGRFKAIVVDDGSYLKELARYSKPQPRVSRKKRVWLWLWGKKPEDYAERYAYFYKKRQELLATLKIYESDARFEIILLKRNVGKRHAQQIAWTHSSGYELYGTVDSDTGVDEDAFKLLASNFANPFLAAATGYVDVGNWHVNWLTRLIDMRYWSAFHVERKAQSFWRSVMCCSGPLAVYRASVVDRFMGRYATQRFLGKYCTFGDDRHLTNLCLREGFMVIFDGRAHCLTEVPTSLRQYMVQQTRWNKSFYREMLWSLQALGTQSKYMTYDLIMQFSLPFLLLGGLGVTVYLATQGNAWGTVGQYVGTIFLVGFIRSLYPFIARRGISWSRRFGQLLFMGYGVIHILVLTPVRIWALIELGLGRTGWGTRSAS
jgi:hyaluronan synthase/N-acetylglucosaminyltransferase